MGGPSKSTSSGSSALDRELLKAQRGEITEFHVYRMLSKATRDTANKAILKRIADDEIKHYAFCKKYTRQNVKPNQRMRWFYYLIARVLGITFAMKLMEKGEGKAQVKYRTLAASVPEIEQVIRDEDSHEQSLIELVNEKHLKYVGSIIRGLNTSVVQLTAILAGLTMLIHDSHLIAVAGMVAGIAIILSSAGTDYLGSQTEALFQRRTISSARELLGGTVYAASTSLAVTFLLAVPFLLLNNRFVSLGVSVLVSLLAISLFNFYLSVSTDVSFRAKFRQMTTISLGTACLGFAGGHLLTSFLTGLDRLSFP